MGYEFNAGYAVEDKDADAFLELLHKSGVHDFDEQTEKIVEGHEVAVFVVYGRKWCDNPDILRFIEKHGGEYLLCGEDVGPGGEIHRQYGVFMSFKTWVFKPVYCMADIGY